MKKVEKLQKLLIEMKEAKELDADWEASHGLADDLLLQTIEVLSAGSSEELQGIVKKIAAIYRQVEKRYA